MVKARMIDARAEVVSALRAGGDLEDVRLQLAWDDERKRTRRGEPFLDQLLDVLVEVYALTGATRSRPIQMEGLVENYLSGYEFRGKVDYRNLHYALTYPALVHGGLQPDLGSDLYYWTSDLWPYVLYAIQADMRIAAARTHRTVEAVAYDLSD
jgi:hypothetical protein